MLDFGALPPEVNSALIYSGPGSAPLMAASSAWNALAGELNSAAAGYGTAITQLSSEEWMGPASAAMADAAAPYVTWMSTTAAQAEQAATQAAAAAGAYETAFAAHVPPPLIAANRAQLAQAVSTNVLGQNTPVIAQLEAQYGEMWAQDAAAMYGYAGHAAAASRVTPFASPAQTTNPAGQALQASAVTQAASSASGTSAQSTLSHVVSSMPNTLAKPRDAHLVVDVILNGAVLRDLAAPHRAVQLPHIAFGVLERIQPIRGLFLQHRGLALLQHRYGQQLCSDGEDAGANRCGSTRRRRTESGRRLGRSGWPARRQRRWRSGIGRLG